jgi:hypothetical protein
MRRILPLSLALAASIASLAAVPAAAGSKTTLTLTKVRASWIGSAHTIFVDTAWAPRRFETKVTIKISVNGEPLRTLKVSNWVIGHKLFQLTVPASVKGGSKARIEARVHSDAGDDRRVVPLALP